MSSCPNGLKIMGLMVHTHTGSWLSLKVLSAEKEKKKMLFQIDSEETFVKMLLI